MTATPLITDVDALLLDVLLPATGLADGQVTETLPPDVLSRLPHVHAYHWGGAAVDPRFLEMVLADVHVRAADRTAAIELAGVCRAGLFEAWERQTIYPHGSIARYEEQAKPAALPGTRAPKGVTVIQATYRLWVCPPPPTS